MTARSETTTIAADVEELPQATRRPWTHTLGIGLVSLVLIAIFSLLTYGLMNKSEGGVTMLRQNRAAPDFSLSLFDGGSFTLSENLGKPVVMNVWASWCESCRAEARDLEAAWRTYESRGVVFIGVNVMDSRDDALRFIDDFGITFPNGADENDIYYEYGVTGTPETFFINREGTIVMKYLGPISPQQMDEMIREIM